MLQRMVLPEPKESLGLGALWLGVLASVLWPIWHGIWFAVIFASFLVVAALDQRRGHLISSLADARHTKMAALTCVSGILVAAALVRFV